MKKLLAILALASVTSMSMAQQNQVGIDMQTQSFANGNPEQGQVQIKYDRKLTNLFTADAGVALNQSENSTTASKAFKTGGRYEIGGKLQAPIFGSPVDGFVRLGLGQKAPSGTERFGYHSQEIGVVYHTPVQGLHAKLGYRWRDSFDAGKGDTSQTTRLALTYDLDKTNSIQLRRDIVRADANNGGDATATAIRYVMKF
jgi:hypothetical protein